MAEIEEHLGVTINQVNNDFEVPIDEHDGKVIYGGKRSNKGIISLMKILVLNF